MGLRKTKAARKHHYLPEFYLTGFTLSGKKDDLLWALDQKSGARWRSRPAEVAHQRDFYRVEVPGLHPEGLEKEFGKIEGEVSSVVREIVRTKSLPPSPGFDILLDFVALLATRVPSARRSVADPVEQVNKMLLKILLATPERWHTTIERMRSDGVHIRNDVTYDAMKRFVYAGNYTVDMGQNFHVWTLLEMANVLRPLLGCRSWVLLVAGQESGEFVCSDRPVALVWTELVPTGYPPGFAMQDTEVTVPLNKELALVGRFDCQSQTVETDRNTVAGVNRRTGMCADRIYSPREDFVWIKRDLNLGNASDLLEAIQKRP